jgi:long-chain acyl-CoA synthetase
MDAGTPLSALYFQADNNPAGVALITGRIIWTYRQLAVAAEQVAQAMHARGVRRGDRVALHMFSAPELVIAYYACFRLGAIAAPLNTRFKSVELRAVLLRLQPKLYIGHAQLLPLIASSDTELLPIDARYVVGETSLTGQSRPWESLLEGSTDIALIEAPPPDAPAVLLGTSGTTGLPKFVTHTGATLAAASQACGHLGFENPQIAIHTVPMVHASGFFILLTGLRFGSIMILIERFDADEVLDAIEEYHATWLIGLPFMFADLVRRQRVLSRKVDSLEYCAVAADVCPPKLQQEFSDTFGAHLRSVWAATEVVGALIHGLHAGPVSRIAPGAQVRLVDNNGEQVRRGEVGELLIRGPNVTVGYWVSPGQIEPATVEGWYHTGDLMRQGEKDDLWFVTRKKDLIIRGGSNISPVEVERVLLDHPAVVDAAIAGVPDEELGQRVVGFVRLAGSSGAYVVNDILASVRAQLADYKVPEWLHVVTEIPRNTIGKIDRRSLLSMLTV